MARQKAHSIKFSHNRALWRRLHLKFCMPSWCGVSLSEVWMKLQPTLAEQGRSGNLHCLHTYHQLSQPMRGPKHLQSAITQLLLTNKSACAMCVHATNLSSAPASSAGLMLAQQCARRARLGHVRTIATVRPCHTYISNFACYHMMVSDHAYYGGSCSGNSQSWVNGLVQSRQCSNFTKMACPCAFPNICIQPLPSRCNHECFHDESACCHGFSC